MGDEKPRSWLDQLKEPLDETGVEHVVEKFTGSAEGLEEVTAVIADPLGTGLDLSKLREEIRPEFLLLNHYVHDKYSQESSYDPLFIEAVRKGVQELHLAYCMHDRGMIPYSPRELLDELMACKDDKDRHELTNKLTTIRSKGSSVGWVIQKMAQEETYRRVLTRLYDEELPAKRMLKRFLSPPPADIKPPKD